MRLGEYGPDKSGLVAHQLPTFFGLSGSSAVAPMTQVTMPNVSRDRHPLKMIQTKDIARRAPELAKVALGPFRVKGGPLASFCPWPDYLRKRTSP